MITTPIALGLDAVSLKGSYGKLKFYCTIYLWTLPLTGKGIHKKPDIHLNVLLYYCLSGWFLRLFHCGHMYIPCSKHFNKQLFFNELQIDKCPSLLSPFVGHGINHTGINGAKYILFDLRQFDAGDIFGLIEGQEYFLLYPEGWFFKMRLLFRTFKGQGK